MTFNIEPTVRDFTESYLVATRCNRWRGMLFLILIAGGLGIEAYLTTGASWLTKTERLVHAGVSRLQRRSEPHVHRSIAVDGRLYH
jgi:hypothetical protein